MKLIRVGLFGFGKTGKLVANEIINYASFKLIWVAKRSAIPDIKYASRALNIDKDEGLFISIDDLDQGFYVNNPVDIIIDFSSSRGVYNYLDAAISNQIKIISAISKYEDDDFKVLSAISDKCAVVHSPNITLGINLLLIAAKTFQNIIPLADIEIIEEHFKEKEEVSGTAKRIASYLNVDEANNIKSIRAGGIVGKHEVIFGLSNQTLRVTHESISRASFGQGAIFAGEWIINREAGMYNMEDIMIELFRANVPDNPNQKLQSRNAWFTTLTKKLNAYFFNHLG